MFILINHWNQNYAKNKLENRSLLHQNKLPHQIANWRHRPTPYAPFYIPSIEPQSPHLSPAIHPCIIDHQPPLRKISARPRRPFRNWEDISQDEVLRRGISMFQEMHPTRSSLQGGLLLVWPCPLKHWQTSRSSHLLYTPFGVRRRWKIMLDTLS